MPEDLISAYNVVHIRLFCTIGWGEECLSVNVEHDQNGQQVKRVQHVHYYKGSKGDLC